MKKTALIASMLLAASTAYAQPWWRPAERYEHQGYHEHEGRWFALGSQTFTYSDRQAIDMRETGPLRRIRIEATRGAPLIHRVVVHYADGSRRAYQVERQLNHKMRESATIDLRGRRVDRVIVMTDPDNISAYQVLGET